MAAIMPEYAVKDAGEKAEVPSVNICETVPATIILIFTRVLEKSNPVLTVPT